MTCREFADFILDYLAGELSSAETALFERHLSRCPHCPEYLNQYKATVEAGRAAFDDPEAEVPGDVPEDLIRAILASRDGL
jgi:anti-sigma factor RsiW